MTKCKLFFVHSTGFRVDQDICPTKFDPHHSSHAGNRAAAPGVPIETVEVSYIDLPYFITILYSKSTVAVNITACTLLQANLFVKGERSATIQMDLSETIIELADKYEKKTGVRLDDEFFLCEGKTLKFGIPLNEQGVANCSHIFLQRRTRGGM